MWCLCSLYSIYFFFYLSAAFCITSPPPYIRRKRKKLWLFYYSTWKGHAHQFPGRRWNLLMEREKKKKKDIKLYTATFYLIVFSYIFCFFIYRRLHYVTRQCNERQMEENGVSDTTKESVQINNRPPSPATLYIIQTASTVYKRLFYIIVEMHPTIRYSSPK